MWVPRRFVIIAAVIGFATALASYLYLAPGAADTTVVVAAGDIPPYVLISEDMVREEAVSADAAHPLSVGETSSAVGRYSTRKILAAEQVLSAVLVRPGDRNGGLAWQVDPDSRAMAVPAPPVAAAGGALQVGNLVDVLHFRDSSVHGPAVGRILLSAVRVLELRDSLGGSWDPGSREAPSTAVLAVTPRQAEALTYAMATGEIFLSVSPFNPEPGDASEAGVGGDNLFGRAPGDIGGERDE